MSAAFDGLVLVLPARPDAEREAVAAAWEARGGTAVRLERFWEPPELPRERVRLYGDMTFCQIVAQTLGLELLSPPDDLPVRLPWEWLGREIEAVSLVAAQGWRFPRFVKPLAAKLFRAGVYASPAELAAETEGLEPETPVLVSEPVTFTGEVRCLMLDGRAVSGGVYEGCADPAAAAQFADALAAALPLPRTFALDVGCIDGYGWVLVEANAVWGAGLNGCDPEGMADCLAAATFARCV